jgi:hypothetical protein
MKAEIEPLIFPLILTRDSVCAGDDCEAPHRMAIEVPLLVDPVALATELAAYYLPSGTAGGLTWTCVLNGVSIAKVTCFGIRALVPECRFADENQAHFVYHSAQF